MASEARRLRDLDVAAAVRLGVPFASARALRLLSFGSVDEMSSLPLLSLTPLKAHGGVVGTPSGTTRWRGRDEPVSRISITDAGRTALAASGAGRSGEKN